MSRGVFSSLNQKTRLWILLLYVVGLFVISKVALNTWLPLTSEKGLWFYSALAALLLGNLLVTPFFTKPADAISYAVPALIALLAVNAWSSTTLTGFDRFMWTIAVAYTVLVLIAAIISIVLRTTEPSFGQRMSKSLYVLCDVLGNPRAIFSVVFLFALLTYHRSDPREYLTIGTAWALFVALRPLEGLANLLRRWRTIWVVGDSLTRLGEVLGHEVPSVVLIREDKGCQATFGDVIVARSDDGGAGYALALDHVGFSDGRWLRAIHLSDSAGEFSSATADGSAFLVSTAEVGGHPKHPIFEGRERLLGLVTSDTTVGQLNIEVARKDLALHQGCLVEVRIGSQQVLYQVIDGITKKEILHQKNTRGFVRADAKKIGTWNAERDGFDSVPWLPQPNEPVQLVAAQKVQISAEAIGFFPGTQYPVRVDLNGLVTHNCAILGILGVGKSFLGLELVERMIEAGIKVLCLDLTPQYAEELKKFYDAAAELQLTDELNDIGRKGKTKISKNVEEGGSVGEFSEKMREHLHRLLAPDADEKLKIYNPVQLEVWRQDSKPYAGDASMATLTPSEITRIITETALDVLQSQGMSEKARCCLVYEEAHSLIPEWTAVASEGDKAATNGTAKAILQGRKFGLGCVVITQRTANVTKSILNQCNTVFALRVFDATGMEFLRNYIGEDYARVLSNLEDRHAVVFGRASSCRDPVLIRLNDRDKFLEGFRADQTKAK